MAIGATGSGTEPLARRMARSALAVELIDFGPDVVAKAKLCLIDFLSCAFEAAGHPWSRQAVATAAPARGYVWGEVFMQVAIYCGVPAGVDSFRVAREVFAEIDKK